jgi:hypothetical protein
MAMQAISGRRHYQRILSNCHAAVANGDKLMKGKGNFCQRKSVCGRRELFADLARGADDEPWLIIG